VNMESDARQILGVNFYVGDAGSAIDRISRGGLVVVPAAPALKDLATNEGYREALLNSEMVIADSACMVLVWNFLQGDSIRRLSGLEYLRKLLQRDDVQRPANTFWIMAGKTSAQKNLEWLRSEGITVPDTCVYEAPIYESRIEDVELINKLQELRPQHIIITVGGGTQERLGLYLKRHLDYLPAIHCIGAAIAFLSGDQVRIPHWADKLYLGWLFRCVSSPRRFVPRYLSARQLVPLIWRYRDRLPVPQATKDPLAQADIDSVSVQRKDWRKRFNED
jgi:N-acetylglucosaminyldiphosphoundecaprenol N-acetyl-beta-D-mannosaminyltransferase